MQDVSSSFTDILSSESIDTFLYIDDIVGYSKDRETAIKNLHRATELLVELGLKEAVHKRNEPHTSIVWLGVKFDTTTGVMSITEEKIIEAMKTAEDWLHRDVCSPTQLKSFLGKLFHISTCAKTLRLFVNRMLNTLREAGEAQCIQLDSAFKEDVFWISTFLQDFNGQMFMDKEMEYDDDLEVDACLSGVGGTLGRLWYAAKLPDYIIQQNLSISILEMLNVLVAVRLFEHRLKNQTVHIRSDSASSISMLQTGKGQCNFMLNCARHVWHIASRSIAHYGDT